MYGTAVQPEVSLDHHRGRNNPLSSAWKSTSRPAEMATCLGQVLVLFVSTIPSVGLSERCAIAVLNDLEGMSRTAVPVVSDPVPAVVGTEPSQHDAVPNYVTRLTCN